MKEKKSKKKKRKKELEKRRDTKDKDRMRKKGLTGEERVNRRRIIKIERCINSIYINRMWKKFFLKMTIIHYIIKAVRFMRVRGM